MSPHTTTASTVAFLPGSSEMGAYIQQVDWNTSPLGPPDQWPVSLRVSVSNMLRTSLPTLVLWGESFCCFYNDAATPGITPALHPIPGQPAHVVWPTHWSFVSPLLNKVRNSGESMSFPNVPLPPYGNGQPKATYWTLCCSPILDDAGATGGVLITGLDTTEAVRQQQQIQASEQRFQGAIRAVQGVLWTNNAVGEMEGEQPAWAALTGQTHAEYQGYGWAKVVHPDDAQPTIDAWNRAVQLQQPFVFEHRLRLKSGGWGLFSVRAIPLFDASNAIKEWVGVHTDLTEQRRAQEALQTSESKLRSVIDNAPMAFALLAGPDFTLEHVNPSFAHLADLKPHHIGMGIEQVLADCLADPQAFVMALQEVYKTGIPFHAAEIFVEMHHQGQIRSGYYNLSFVPLFDAAGQVYAIADMAFDVTEQVLARQKIERAEASSRRAVDLAQLATWTLDIATEQHHYSDRFIEWLGFSETTSSGEPVYNPIPEPHRQRVIDAVQAAIQPGASGRYEQEHPIINQRTGQVRTIHVLAQVSYNPQGEPVSLSGTAQDITIQRKLRYALEQQVQERTDQLAAANAELARSNQELQHSNLATIAVNEKLAESNHDLLRSNDNLQQFAYVASHDLQEPLRKIRQFGDLLASQHADQLGDGLHYLQRMQQAAGRMSTLIHDLLSYSRISTQQATPTPVDLNAVLDEVMTDLDMRIQETGAVIQREKMPTLRGDAPQLGQLFLNLLSNALKFQRPGVPPLVQISSQRVPASALPASVQPPRPAKTYYRLTITDNGIGFDPRYAEQIFQVFQRLHSKSTYVGTGIGLAICEKVAANHGGTIRATSQPNQGATFEVYLPA